MTLKLSYYERKLQELAASLNVDYSDDGDWISLTCPKGFVFDREALHYVDRPYGGDPYPHATASGAARWLLLNVLGAKLERCEIEDCSICEEDEDE